MELLKAIETEDVAALNAERSGIFTSLSTEIKYLMKQKLLTRRYTSRSTMMIIPSESAILWIALDDINACR